MSCEYELHCKTCDSSIGDINHGDEILRSMVRVYPHIKAAHAADTSGHLSTSILGYNHYDVFSWLDDHYGHDLELRDEYGRTQPLGVVRVPGYQHREEKQSTRDDQFAGFAARLLQELLDQGAYVAISEWATGGDSLKSEQLITRRAYDLVHHTLEFVPQLVQHVPDAPDVDSVIGFVPDMTEWSEEISK